MLWLAYIKILICNGNEISTEDFTITSNYMGPIKNHFILSEAS